MSEHVLSILVKAVGTAQAAKNLKGIDRVVSGIGGKAGKGLRTATDNIKTLGVAAGGIAVTGLALAVNAAASFESQLNTINTIAGIKSPAALGALGDALRKTSRDSGVSLNDLTDAYYNLLSGGIKAADAQGVLNSAVTLGIGGLATTSQTIDLLVTALNVYGGGAKQAAQYADYFAQAIAAGVVTADEIASSFANVAPLAKSAGIEIQEVAAGYAQLTAKGETGASASTAMAAAILALQRKSADLLKVEKKLGVNFADIAKKQGLAKAYQAMRLASEKYNIPLIKLVGRQEALAYAFDVTKENAASYAKNLKDVQGATGVAAKQAAERQKGLNYELSRLKAIANDVGITIGSKLLPKLTPLAEKAVAFLETHQADIDKFGDSIASAFDKAGSFAQKIPWGTIGSGLQAAAEWASKLMDVFLALPPEFQTTLIALAGLNKLSGGAIGGVISELGKGLIKGVLGMNAGVVNINAGVVNGAVGVGGAAGAAGAAGGGLAGILKSAVKAGVGLGIAAIGSNVLSGGVQQGGSVGAGQAAAGGLGMIAGLTVAFGPGGAIAGSIIAVGQTLLEIRGQNAQIATGIATSVGEQITGGAKLGDLRQSLDAVNTGINEIQANPINVLLAGDALDNLRAQRDLLQSQISHISDDTVRTVAATERAEANMTTAQADAAAATRDVGAKTEANRIAIAAAASRTASAAAAAGVVAKSGGLAAAAAIAAKKLAVSFAPVINTSVSVRETINTRTTYKKYFTTAS